MKLTAVLMFLPCAAIAQTFDTPPAFTVDGVTVDALSTNTCLSARIAEGPAALVTQEARDCIGTTANACEADPVICAGIEQSYWDWRIAQNYAGLQAWASAKRDIPQYDSLRASTENPAGATANVALECALRINLQDQPETAPLDLARCQMRETALIALELEFTVRQACAGKQEGAFADFCAEGD